ncbi:MAG: SDR family NAD(P)-dependent oxidoreductase [Pseudomonadales bacterium]|nr:SDR family NAD(P)-dependent oxidoreductase [Pseudomonadales bacterium]
MSKILVTGGTGFVGSHVCKTLLQQGREVRLLVRNIDKAKAMYARLSVSPEFFQGDITDISSVGSALAGCDGAVHAAAATPMQIDSIDKLFEINVEGVKNVVGSALDAGIQNIVCISSVTAIFSTDASKVTADAAPVPSKMPYGQSKVEAENYLRSRQAAGDPIAVVYPGGIIGPEDPGMSDAVKALKHRIENGFRIFGDGGMQHIDVRDLAAFICDLVTEGGSGRFLVPGVYCSWTELADIVEEVSGANLKRISAKGWKLRLIGSLVDVARKFKRIDTPISAETMKYATLWPNIANTEELSIRGISLREPRETFADTVASMVSEGLLSKELCPSAKSTV